MLGKIKYTYMPKNRATDAILSSLSYGLKSTGAIDFRIIDNKDKGRRLYPPKLSSCVLTCEIDNLKTLIENLVEDDVEVILLNDFDLDLDDIKEEFCKIVQTYDILLCVNNIVDLENSKNNISVLIDPEIHELEGEEWEDVKEGILENLNEKRDSIYNNISSLKDSSISSLLDLFNLDSLYSNDDKEIGHLDIEDIDIKEQYSYTTKDSEMCVSLTETDEILITCNEDYVVVPKEQIGFLFDTLKKLMK